VAVILVERTRGCGRNKFSLRGRTGEKERTHGEQVRKTDLPHLEAGFAEGDDVGSVSGAVDAASAAIDTPVAGTGTLDVGILIVGELAIVFRTLQVDPVCNLGLELGRQSLEGHVRVLRGAVRHGRGGRWGQTKRRSAKEAVEGLGGRGAQMRVLRG
jgi:hypothetical protein